MDTSDRMPSFVLPFTIVGASAGWLAAALCDNPILDATPSHASWLAAICSGAIGGLLGAALQRKCAPREAWVSTQGMWIQVTFAVLVGGATSGAITGGLAFGNERGATSGALAGLGAAIVFVPVCALVIAASRRAARARLGSIVASADRRELWALMAAALAVTTAAAYPDWMARRWPAVALGMAASALAAVMVLLAWDGLAARALRQVAEDAERMELRENGEVEAEGTVPSLDLGLGDEVRAQMARSAAAYRGRDRAASLLVGSLDEARTALRHAVFKKIAAAAVAVLALAGHWFAARPRGEIVFHEILCDRGSPIDCGVAAAMLRDGDGDDLVHAVVLATHACEAFKPPDLLGCRTAAEIIDVDPERADAGTRLRYRERACAAGDAASCRTAAELLETRSENLWRVAAVLQRGCDVGDMRSCVDAAHARDVASHGGSRLR